MLFSLSGFLKAWSLLCRFPCFYFCRYFEDFTWCLCANWGICWNLLSYHLRPSYTHGLLLLACVVLDLRHRGVQYRVVTETECFHITCFSSSTFPFKKKKKGRMDVQLLQAKRPRGKRYELVCFFFWHYKDDPGASHLSLLVAKITYI